MSDPIAVVNCVQRKRDVEAGRELIIAVNHERADMAGGIRELRKRMQWQTDQESEKNGVEIPDSNIQFPEELENPASQRMVTGLFPYLVIGFFLDVGGWTLGLWLPHSKTGVMKRYVGGGHGMGHAVNFIAKRLWVDPYQSLLHTFVVPAEAGLVQNPRTALPHNRTRPVIKQAACQAEKRNM